MFRYPAETKLTITGSYSRAEGTVVYSGTDLSVLSLTRSRIDDCGRFDIHVLIWLTDHRCTDAQTAILFWSSLLECYVGDMRARN